MMSSATEIGKLFPLYLGTSLGILNELISFRFLPPLQIIILISGGALIGFLGSLSSVSRFLNV